MFVSARPFRNARCSAVIFRGEQSLARFVEGCAAEFKVGDMRLGSGLTAIVAMAGELRSDDGRRRLLVSEIGPIEARRRAYEFTVQAYARHFTVGLDEAKEKTLAALAECGWLEPNPESGDAA